MLRLVIEFPQFLLSSVLIKAISQGVIKKMFLAVRRQNKQSVQEQLCSQSDVKTQLGAQAALQFNVLNTV